DDVRIFGPRFLEPVAVDARNRRPRGARFQYQSVLERQPDELGEPAIGLRVARDNEDAAARAHAAAGKNSWTRPPRMSRRLICAGEARAPTGVPFGAASSSDRCGRSPL